ncbi:hypothetical protein KCU81_g868, partial [Aureobasidium melanogenum]
MTLVDIMYEKGHHADYMEWPSASGNQGQPTNTAVNQAVGLHESCCQRLCRRVAYSTTMTLFLKNFPILLEQRDPSISYASHMQIQTSAEK